MSEVQLTDNEVNFARMTSEMRKRNDNLVWTMGTTIILATQMCYFCFLIATSRLRPDWSFKKPEPDI